MVQKCTVKGCERQGSGNEIAFHRFPLNNLDLSKIWLTFCDDEDVNALDLARLKNPRVCSVHFLPEVYDRLSPKMKLKPFVVPTCNCPRFRF
jgi:hypothetical protein